MNFDVLNQTETIFDEIAGFYGRWNTGPDLILSDLLQHPQTRLRIDANQRNRDNALLQQMQVGRSTPMPDVYQLSGRDVYSWLYNDRILPLRGERLTALKLTIRDVQTDSGERSRVDWCQGLQRVLNSLSEQLMTLDSKYPSMPNRDEDWPDIDKTLRTIANHYIRPLIEQYQQIVNRYLPDQSEPATSTPIADERIKLTHSQIAMLYHYTNQPITRNNANAIAQKYGQTSGQKLLDIYGRMTSPLERTATAKNTIKNFSKVMPLLSGKSLELANSELADARRNNSK